LIVDSGDYEKDFYVFLVAIDKEVVEEEFDIEREIQERI